MIDHVLAHTMPAAFSLLPVKMRSQAARAMLLAIGLQESRFDVRYQIGGPARGFWQFERAGVAGVLTHTASAGLARSALLQLRYPDWMFTAPGSILAALEHNDTLACGFARLLLFTLPDALPGPQDHEDGWRQYLAAWRPGKPHRATWDAFYDRAWARVWLAP